MGGSLDPVTLKLVRAEQHLEAILKLLDGFRYGDCEIVPEEDPETNLGLLRVRLPTPPQMLIAIIGDFLFNVRCALDYLVSQLVLANGGTPTKWNSFPICFSPSAFANDRRQKLREVSEKACTLIESLQPYSRGNELLGTLNRLHNVDKHQTPTLTVAVAHDARLDWIQGANPLLHMIVGNEELRDGAVFGDIGIPFDNPELPPRLRDAFRNMKVQGKASIFVAFDDPAVENLELLRIDSVLQEILEFVRGTVVPAFEPFFN